LNNIFQKKIRYSVRIVGCEVEVECKVKLLVEKYHIYIYIRDGIGIIKCALIKYIHIQVVQLNHKDTYE
jgi:hypothetical protein